MKKKFMLLLLLSFSANSNQLLSEKEIKRISDVSWIDTKSDKCNGMRQAKFNENVYFARSKSSRYSEKYKIPIGFRWLSKKEYRELYNKSEQKNKEIKVFYDQCGIKGYPRSREGVPQYNFDFSDKGFNGLNAGNYEYHGLNLFRSYNFAGYVLFKY